MTHPELVEYLERFYAWQREEAERTLEVVKRLKASGLKPPSPSDLTNTPRP